MAHLKGMTGTFTSYSDKVFGLIDAITDSQMELTLPLIQKLYEGSVPHEEAATRIEAYFVRLSNTPEVDVYMPNDNPDSSAPSYIELYKEGVKGVKKIITNPQHHPFLIIQYDDGTETTIIGMPFVMRKSMGKEAIDPILDKPEQQKTRL